MSSARLDEFDDYLSGVMPDSTAGPFEDRFFTDALDAAGPTPAAWFATLRAQLRVMSARGTLFGMITRAQFEALRLSGVRVALWNVDDAARSSFVIPRDAELVVVRFALETGGATRFEIDLGNVGSPPMKTVEGTLPTNVNGEFYGCCEVELARSASGAPVQGRFYALDAAGTRRLVRDVILESTNE